MTGARALDGSGVARSVRIMANALRTATETIIDMLVDDVLARFPRILARLGEGVPGGVDGEGFGGLR